MKVRIDTPIQNPDEDVIGRARLAESFSEQLLSLDTSEGIVTGVLGPLTRREKVTTRESDCPLFFPGKKTNEA